MLTVTHSPFLLLQPAQRFWVELVLTLLVFTSGADLITSSISGGGDGDSLVFSAVVKSAASIAGGGGADTMVFNSSVGGA